MVSQGGNDHTSIFEKLNQVVVASDCDDFVLDASKDSLVLEAKALRDAYKKNRAMFEEDDYVFEAALRHANSAEYIGLERDAGVESLTETLFPGRDARKTMTVARNLGKKSDRFGDLDANEFKTFLWLCCDCNFAFSSDWDEFRSKYLEPLLKRIKA